MHSVNASDSIGVKKTDQLFLSQKDSVALHKTSSQNDAGVELVFGDTSHHNQVEVTVDDNGNQTIKATGFIQSVKTKQAHTLQALDSSYSKDRHAFIQTSHDSSNLKTNVNTTASDNSKMIVRQKKSWQLPWYGYVVLLVLVLWFFIGVTVAISRSSSIKFLHKRQLKTSNERKKKH